MVSLRKSQLGGRNRRVLGRKSLTGKTHKPWGDAIPARFKKRAVGGSSRRKSTPDARLRGLDYPANDPAAWPVDLETLHALAAAGEPLPGAIPQEKIDERNAIVEQAYHRAKYQ